MPFGPNRVQHAFVRTWSHRTSQRRMRQTSNPTGEFLARKCPHRNLSQSKIPRNGHGHDVCQQHVQSSRWPFDHRRFQRQFHSKVLSIATSCPKSVLLQFYILIFYRYQTEYGFLLNRNIIIDDIRVRGIGKGYDHDTQSANIQSRPAGEYPKPIEVCKNNENLKLDHLLNLKVLIIKTREVYFDSKFMATKLYLIEDVQFGDKIDGPSIIIDKNRFSIDLI